MPALSRKGKKLCFLMEGQIELGGAASKMLLEIFNQARSKAATRYG
jgi:hypothetical protein